jgi:arsenite methyltransferase
MHELVKDYYGNQLKSTADLRTSACCDASLMPEWMKPLLARIHPEVMSRYYGCGLVCPTLLDGLNVLDLGCGSGRDVYALAQLVGEAGNVVGVDMTEEQLAVAETYREHHRWPSAFPATTWNSSWATSNAWTSWAWSDASFDVVVSNCVVNLSPDKEAVLRQVHRLLKTGGEFYFSDIYADRRVPRRTAQRPGAVRRMPGRRAVLERLPAPGPPLRLRRPAPGGRPPHRHHRPGHGGAGGQHPLLLRHLPPVQAGRPGTRVRGLWPGGGLPGRHPPPRKPCFILDKHHAIEAGRVFPVCGNTWRMLADTRFAPHFEFIGDFSRHYGLFAGCGGGLPFDEGKAESGGACC